MFHGTETVCCFTGHRELPKQDVPLLVCRLEKAISDLIENGYNSFCAGGALGFDTVAAQTVLHMKATNPHIQLILILPCESQTKAWSRKDKETYENIKKQADRFVYLSKDYYPGCMQKRNRYLVDNSSVCICYLTKTSGGTAYTVDYARKKGKKVIHIAQEA